jgi:hypothetical protein
MVIIKFIHLQAQALLQFLLQEVIQPLQLIEIKLVIWLLEVVEAPADGMVLKPVAAEPEVLEQMMQLLVEVFHRFLH